MIGTTARRLCTAAVVIATAGERGACRPHCFDEAATLKALCETARQVNYFADSGVERHALDLCAEGLRATPAVAVHFLFPHIRVEFLLRTMLTRQWDDEAWPLVRHEIQKALALRSRLRKAGWWN